MWVTKESILSKLDEETIYQYYFPERIIKGKHKYRNPFRYDRRAGSCVFSWYRGRFYFTDFATRERIDCFSYLMRRHGITFYEALVKINLDFDLGLYFSKSKVRLERITKEIPFIKPKKIKLTAQPKRSLKIRTEFNIKIREWLDEDIKYWRDHGISRNTLGKYQVSPILSYKANYGGNRWYKKYDYIKDKDPAYVYRFFKDNRLSVKIYRPLVEDKSNKWRTNCDDSIIQGWEQLPSTGDLLIITSSLKDVMVMYEAGYTAVACQSEAVKIKSKVLSDLKKRFKEIIICLDTDATGIKSAQKFSEVSGLQYVVLPSYGKCKDPADIAKKYGIQVLKDTIANQISTLKSKTWKGINKGYFTSR